MDEVCSRWSQVCYPQVIKKHKTLLQLPIDSSSCFLSSVTRYILIFQTFRSPTLQPNCPTSGPYIVEKQVRPSAYCLKLLFLMKRLYLVFSVIKLMAAIEDLISSRYPLPLPNTILIDRQEWEVEKILDS